MTAPSIVDFRTANRTGNGLTLTVDTPTHTNLVDKIYVLWASDGDDDTATISGTGWSTLYNEIDLPSTSLPNAGAFYGWYKLADSEPSTYTVTATVP